MGQADRTASRSSSEPWAASYAEHLSILTQRLEEALAACRFDGLVVFAGREHYPSRDDVAYPFRAEPYFKAWLPLTRHPGSILKLEPGKRPVLIYLQEESFWHQPPADPAGYWVKHFEIRRARNQAEARAALGGPLTHFAALGEQTVDGETFRAVSDTALLAHLDYYRAYKTPYEIACIAEANRIAARGHLAVRSAFKEGHSELELHTLYCQASEQRESELPYPSIVALNEHASILHYQHLERSRPARLRSFLIDAGADLHGYAADVTRTHAADPELDALIADMDDMQQSLCAQVRAGVDFVDLNEETHRRLAQVLVRHRFVRCSPEEAYASGITRTFLPHGLGHLLGLQVHDAGGRQVAPDGTMRPPPEAHPFLRLTRTLEAGFVLTIEPGLYFIPSLLQALEAGPNERHVDWRTVRRFLPCGGIRVEDNLVVEADGARNLTRAAIAAPASPPRNALH